MLKNLSSFPNALLYLPAAQGGTGLQRFSSICQVEKLRLMTRLHEGDKPCLLAAHSIIHRAASTNGLQLLPHQEGTLRYNSSQPSSFLGTCIQWCELHQSPMFIGGLDYRGFPQQQLSSGRIVFRDSGWNHLTAQSKLLFGDVRSWVTSDEGINRCE